MRMIHTWSCDVCVRMCVHGIENDSTCSNCLGLAMNQIELEKIADTFDKDKSGMIDLSEIISTLKDGNRKTRRPVMQEAAISDAQKIANEVSTRTCEHVYAHVSTCMYMHVVSGATCCM